MFILPILLASLAFGQISCSKAANGRIIGGKFAAPGQFPYQISLQLRINHICGGSIISPNWILTAAHCVVGKNQADLHVIAGLTDLLSGTGKTFNIAEVVVHPKYEKVNHDYDLALLRVSTPIPLGGLIQKISLSPFNAVYNAKKMAVVSGFGVTNKKMEPTNKLQYADVPLADHDDCKHYYQITDRMICAGYPHGQVSSCPGDSGGPLTVDGKLFGVVSWGMGCGNPHPTMYAYVAAFRSWIQQVSGV